MTRPPRVPAKLARPAAIGLVRRPRLFHLLDQASRAAWICGPPGSGKTALAASYADARRCATGWYQLDGGDGDLAAFFHYVAVLARQLAPARRTSLPTFTPAFSGGIAVFARRFFEAFFARAPRRSVLVLDEYDAVPAGSALHDVMPELLASVPSGSRVIVTSREEPPPALGRLRAQRAMTVIGWDALRFTASDVRLLARRHHPRRSTPGDVDAITQRSQGWAAGAVLLLDTAAAKAGGTDDVRSRAVFDYFMAEVLASLSPADQRALLSLALLPTVMASAAVEIAESSSAPPLLERLSRRHWFVERRDVGETAYRFHPMFHEFLRARAATALGEEEQRRILRAGAVHLADAGQISDAADLLLDAQDWKALEDLVVQHAPRMARGGLAGAVAAWLARMPDEVVRSSPWLSYWCGVTRMARGIAAAREHLGRAAHGFHEAGDAAACAAALAAIFESFFLEAGTHAPIDPWIDMASRLIDEHGDDGAALPPALLITLFRALVYRRPDSPRLPPLRDRLHVIRGEARVTEHAVAAGLALAHHYGWVGEPMTAAPLVRAAREQAAALHDVVTLQTADYVEAFVAIKLGDGELCEAAVTRALERAETTGMHALDHRLQAAGVYAARMLRDPARAARRLAWLSEHLAPGALADRCQYHMLAGWDLAVRGDVERAYRECRTSLALGEAAGVPSVIALTTFLLAQLAHERGDADEARARIAEMRRISEGMRSQSMIFMTEMVEADLAYARGDEAGGTRLLRAGLERARRQNLRFYAGWRPSVMSRLCVAALERDICVEYVQALVRHHALVPDRAPVDIPRWPWAIEIAVLGSLRVRRAGEALKITGKAPQRPLDLLRALIACGGRHVPAQRLVDALWPEADGDAGHVALDTNLLRLRRLLQHPGALVVENGQVSLDEGLVTVDAWTLARGLDRLEGLLQRDAAPAELARHGHDVLRRYAGPLLADCDHEWAVAPRERLRRRVVRVAEAIARGRERADDAEGALATYLLGLQVDDLAEGFYQGAMRCYVALGRHAEGAALHERCRQVFATQLGVEPSAATAAIASTTKPPAR
jgi:ATP/maltotriose-dependent transcriptional regulator MalT/DNA-binding SARP family transcriptional activator